MPRSLSRKLVEGASALSLADLWVILGQEILAKLGEVKVTFVLVGEFVGVAENVFATTFVDGLLG